MFKSKYRSNLTDLIDECVNQGKSLSMPQYRHGLLVFGGVDPDTGLKLPSVFDIGFSCKNCIDFWTKIGAAPLTRKFLKDPQVRKSIDANNKYALVIN